MNLAYLNGRFLPAAELHVSVHDAGFVQGVAIAERLRTFSGRLFRLEEHLARLANSLAIADLIPPVSLPEIPAAARELVATNHAQMAAGDDLGLILFATPGDTESGPIIAMHTQPLPFGTWAPFYEQGQPLIVSSIRQVPATCWPPELKCRSRMHYYLADREANRRERGARAILLDQDGFVSEASTANVVAYFSGEGLVSPPRKKILPGISIAMLEELAVEMRITFVDRDLTVDELLRADEVMLCSTSPCVYPVSRIDARPISGGSPGPIVRRLLAAWSDRVGVDIVQQARQFASRPRNPSR